jgi:hypothetical protein
MKRNHKLVLGAVLGAAVVVSGAGVAFGSIPGSDNSVTACVTSSTGAVRIVDVDAGQTCQSTETRVTWGGGMRFRGVWTVAPGTTGPGSIPYSQSNPVRKGDVIRYDGPSGQFGCTTPKGAWVSVVGQHSYPCLEFPQNWAPLALDGATGKPGSADTHWVRLNAAGQVIASSRSNIASYPSGTGNIWVYFPGVDMSKCAVTVSANEYGGNAVVTEVYPYYTEWALAMARKADGTYVARAMTVVANCGKTS